MAASRLTKNIIIAVVTRIDLGNFVCLVSRELLVEVWNIGIYKVGGMSIPIYS